jgi:hypothetical protein
MNIMKTPAAWKTRLAVAVAALVVILAPATPAHAIKYFPPNTYYFENLWGGRCLDGGAASLATPAQLWTCNGTPDQQWTLVWPFGDITFQIKSVQSGGCLGVYLGYTGNGTSVRTLPCTSNWNVRWTGGFVKGLYGFTNVQSGTAMDADASSPSHNGTRVQIWDWNYNNNQHWLQGNSW